MELEIALSLYQNIQFYIKINPIPYNSMFFGYFAVCLFSDTYVKKKKINFSYKNFHIRKSEILKTNAASVFFKIIIN